MLRAEANFEAMDDSAKDNMFVVQTWLRPITDEYPRPVGVRSFVCHRQYSWVRVGVPNLFVIKSTSIHAESIREVVPALHHEISYYPMETVSLVVVRHALLTSA